VYSVFCLIFQGDLTVWALLRHETVCATEAAFLLLSVRKHVIRLAIKRFYKLLSLVFYSYEERCIILDE
jgi:hypothetical protein